MVKVLDVVKDEARGFGVQAGQFIAVGDPELPKGAKSSCLKVDALEKGFEYILYAHPGPSGAANGGESFLSDMSSNLNVSLSHVTNATACEGSPSLIRGWCLGTMKEPSAAAVAASINACEARLSPSVLFYLYMAILCVGLVCLGRKCVSVCLLPRDIRNGYSVRPEVSPVNVRAMIAERTRASEDVSNSG